VVVSFVRKPHVYCIIIYRSGFLYIFEFLQYVLYLPFVFIDGAGNCTHVLFSVQYQLITMVILVIIMFRKKLQTAFWTKKSA